MKNRFLKIFGFVSVSFFGSCVEPYDISVATSQTILIVDGTIDDSNKDQFISLQKFIPSTSGNIRYDNVEKAIVMIVKDGKDQFPCIYKEKGKYYLPLGFKANVGSKYKLKITLDDGKQYESSEELMRLTPEITGYTVKFDKQGIKQGDTNIPAHVIYIDTKDPVETGDNFMWDWRLFEKQVVCKTCFGGIYLSSPAPQGRCISVAALGEIANEYDYSCSGNCWEILYSQELNVMSDVFSQGREIKNRLVAKVPYYQTNGFLIEIKQQLVSASAFQYLKILANQTQNNGTLVDSPPAPLTGNIININDRKESVGGYFLVGNSKIKRIWVDRLDALGTNTYDLLGRKTNYEPPSPDGSRPPFAPCILTNTQHP